MKRSMNESIKRNEEKHCSVEGCCHLRHKLYNTCVHHFSARKLHGHYKARAIRKREMLRERDQVTDLIMRNIGHEGIKKAIDWFEQWMRDAASGKPKVVGVYHLRRLHEHGINGLQILIACAAIFLYSYRHPKLFPDNRSLNYALTHQAMSLIPLEYIQTHNGKRRAVQMNGTDRQAIGEHIKNSIGCLFVNMERYISKQEEQEHNMRQSLLQSLS